MIVSDLDTMERIVQNRRDLIWEGWDVIKLTKSPMAILYKDGRRINGAWFRTKRYPIAQKGWSVPNDFIKS